MKEAVPYAAPLLVFAAFVIVRKVATGRFFHIYDFETDALFDLGLASSLQQAAAGALAVALTLWSLARDPSRGQGEDNLQYLGIVGMHQATAREVETRYAEARIVSAWPTAPELSDPLPGYVTRPLRVEWFTGQLDLSETDVVVIARPANDAARRLEALVRSPGWYVSSRRRHGVNEITVYERSASGGRGA